MYLSLIFVIFALALMDVSAFAPSARALLSPQLRVQPGSSALGMFGGGKRNTVAVEEAATEKTYWEGDWVCADCGYIYDADIDGNGLPFEEMKRGFICPQCSAPRKRYAKAVNGQWGVTNDGGDLPIYAWTIAGLAATVWFALVYVPTL